MSTGAQIIASGVVSALGNGVAANLQALYDGRDGCREQLLPEFIPPITVPYCAVVDAPTDARQRLAWLLDETLQQLLAEHPLSVDERRNLPLFIGSSGYGIGIGEQIYRQQYQQQHNQEQPQQHSLAAMPLPLDGFTQISSHLRQHHQLRGADYAFNTACTATGNALLAAISALDAGECDYALVVGLETYNATTLGGFYGMQLLATAGMKPFDLRRNGLVLGEGCGMLLLRRSEAGESGLSLLGGASRCDTYSISASNPDGSTIADVMQAALATCGVSRSAIKAIKAHGTATPLNDDSEAAGMRRLFGDKTMPPFFSLKAALGHTLGSCGVIETLLTAACLQSGLLPASCGFSEADPTLAVIPMQQPLAAGAGNYLLNFFGFGGNNCSLLLRYANGTAL